MSKKTKEIKAIQKKAKNNNDKLQKYFGIDGFKEDCLVTCRNECIYYIEVMPKNISVLSESINTSFINALANVLTQLEHSELLCVDSSQNYDANINYLKSLKEHENNSQLSSLDSADISFMDDIHTTMASSRMFFIVVRISTTDYENFRGQTINRAIQLCKEHNFDIKLAGKEKIKKMISVYLERNMYDDKLTDYDGEQYGLDKDNYDLKDFVDLVSPSVVDFKHRDYYIVGNTYRCAWALRRYKTQTQDIALLSDIGESEGVTLHIYNNIVSPANQDKIFNNAQRRNKNIFNSENDITKKIDSTENLNEMEQMLRETHKSKEDFMHCSVYIEIIANSLKELEIKQGNVKKALAKNKMLVDKLATQQRDGFASVCPFGADMFGSEFTRVLPCSSVANLFPFSYAGKTDPMGFFIGKDVHGTNILVDFDRRDNDKTNGHIAIYGNSGEGKSYFIKLLMCIFRQQGKNLYSLDSEKEFIKVTKELGGTNLNMMSGKYFINVLEPKMLVDPNDKEYLDSTSDEPEAFQRSTVISQHIAFLRDFFKTYNPELTGQHLDTLEIMLEEVYKKFHITDNTDLRKLQSTDFPILSDLFNEIQNQLSMYDEVSAIPGTEILYTKDILRSLALGIRSICVGTDSKFFNGYTNLPNANHINFDIKELLNTNENLKNAMYFNILSYMQNKFLVEGNTVVVVDELHELIRSLIVIMYLRSFIKRGRKKDSKIITASQNLGDLLLPEIAEYTKPFFSIPTHRFLFFPGVVPIKEYISITNLLDSEWNIINTPHQGYCLYCCGNERYNLHIIAPTHKEVLFGTAGGR